MTKCYPPEGTVDWGNMQAVDLSLLLTTFDVAGQVSAARDVDPPLSSSVREVLANLGGVSLNGGLYRCHAPERVESMTGLAVTVFPEFRGRVECFGTDWLGRQFAADDLRSDEAGVPLVLLMDPGTGYVLQIPESVVTFHEHGLVHDAEPALAASFYQAWRAGCGDDRPLNPDECVGYRVPLFLGGSDDVDNLERTDFEVYWTFAAQLRHGAAGLEPGTQIASVTKDEYPGR